MAAPTHDDAVLLLKLCELSSTPAQERAWKFVFSDDFIDMSLERRRQWGL
jgi:hypothetical protein